MLSSSIEARGWEYFGAFCSLCLIGVMSCSFLHFLFFTNLFLLLFFIYFFYNFLAIFYQRNYNIPDYIANRLTPIINSFDNGKWLHAVNGEWKADYLVIG